MAKKGEQIVKIIRINDIETASLHTIAKVSKGIIYLEDSNLTYEQGSGREIDPAPAFGPAGISSRLVELEQ